AEKQMQAFLKVSGTMDILVNLFLVALLPAICEEVCFRGALQRILIHISRSPWIGIIVTSIIFSALHLQFQGFLPRMFLGILLGALYWYSGSLWTSILAHFINNAVQVVAVSYAPDIATKDPSIPFIAALISALAVLAVIWLFKSFSTVTYEKVYEPDDLNKVNQFIA
ncbi:MAG TPA: CPBP family intramembrane glutamic endopeptidase, partial [Flavitalea sp.]|nr:CPBP family intramembrane glutamic endopeptidase [Flavitalea sp.]